MSYFEKSSLIQIASLPLLLNYIILMYYKINSSRYIIYNKIISLVTHIFLKYIYLKFIVIKTFIYF